MRRFFFLFVFCLALPVGSRAAVHNVRTYGAKGDGRTIDSPSINAAIHAAAKAGGGTVYFPAGTYASYSIRLESHISLFLEKGAVLLAGDGKHVGSPHEISCDAGYHLGIVHSHAFKPQLLGDLLRQIFCG